MKTIRERVFPGTTSMEPRPYEEEHRKVALEAAREGIVLLENKENFLPLSTDKKLALFGASAVQTIKGGTGSGDVNERSVVSIYQGLEEAGYEITSKDWLNSYKEEFDRVRAAWRDVIIAKTEELERENFYNAFFETYSNMPFRVPEGAPVYATDTDTAIMVIGRNAGENADRVAQPGDYYLSEGEHQQLSDLCSMYDNVIMLINAGGPVDTSFMDEFPQIKALLFVAQPGMEGGHAIADVISGKVNPSGRLTDSWTYRYEDYPNAMTFSHNKENLDEEEYLEGIFVGYRYFDSFNVPVRYSFGHGLSYTRFFTKLTQIEVMNDADGTIHLTIDVTNIGPVAGKEVVQVYFSLPDGKLEKEKRRLVAFAKTKLLVPGETEELTLTYHADRLASYDEESASWILEEGTYGVFVGNSLANCKLTSALILEASRVIRRVTNVCPQQKKINSLHLKKEDRTAWAKSIEEEVLWGGIPSISGELHAVKTEYIPYESNPNQAGSHLIQDAARELVESLSTDQLIKLATGDTNDAQGGVLGSSGVSVPGSAGETSSCAKEEGLANIVLADGPAGLRLNQFYYVKDNTSFMLPFQGSVEQGYFNTMAAPDNSEKYYQYCTAIPVGTMLAQTWNMPLLEKVGDMIGKEMEIFDVQLWLAPGMNIHRNPLCGRNFEYYSEDPYLTGKCAAAITKGVQSHPGIGTTIKHFACNNQEANRFASDSIIEERALREIYLKGFEIAIKDAQPYSIMTSYNLINGIHAANNYDLCTKVARCEFGFHGVIMTDWGTTNIDENCTAAGCMRAGNDLVMPGMESDHDNLRAELEAGTLTIDQVKNCVTHLARVILKTNCYE